MKMAIARSMFSGEMPELCGVTMTFGIDQRGLSSGSGSTAKTSRQAPAIHPSDSAWMSAGSWMTRPRATLISVADGFIALQGGDAARARQLAREARTNLPTNAAAQLLEARADLALGDMHAAREHYRALISNRKTALAALLIFLGLGVTLVRGHLSARPLP